MTDKHLRRKREREGAREGTTEATIETLRGAKSFPHPFPLASFSQGEDVPTQFTLVLQDKHKHAGERTAEKNPFSPPRLSADLYGPSNSGTLHPWLACVPTQAARYHFHCDTAATRTSRLPVWWKRRGLGQKLIIRRALSNDPASLCLATSMV